MCEVISTYHFQVIRNLCDVAEVPRRRAAPCRRSEDENIGVAWMHVVQNAVDVFSIVPVTVYNSE